MKRIFISFALLLLVALSVNAVGYLEVRAPGYNFRNADYSTSHVFIDEVAGTNEDIEVLWNLNGFSNITDVEVFTNLNRRDLARNDKNGDFYPDGIQPVDRDTIDDSVDHTDPESGHYYAPINMVDQDLNGIWELTIPAAKTGAYRLTARFKTSDLITENNNDPNNWIWYGLRDHAIVVAPVDSRDVQLYVMNVFNVEADGDQFQNRSTLEDLHDASNAAHNQTDGEGNYTGSRWNLDYLRELGMNWLWFQPIHPNGFDGREPVNGYGNGGPLYDPGSPYAVKNFFAVNELMSVDYDGINADLATNRQRAMEAFQDFAEAADSKDVGIMLDAPFNHTAFDVELAEVGIDLFQPDGETWSATNEIRNRVPEFFSKDYNQNVTGSIDDLNTPQSEYIDGGEVYSERASNGSEVAAGPDRFDFGKWRDVKDVFFGRYDALVEFNDFQRTEAFSFKNEGDWFDFEDTEWNSNDFVKDTRNWNVTRRVWDYFAEYAVFWLAQTRPEDENMNSADWIEAGNSFGSIEERYAWDARGIDGLRCDFGQGLPPRAWEYIINVARSHKWNFVMMSESLDGEQVTYRSSRHFEILNENIVFPLKSAGNAGDYEAIFEGRRSAYGQAVVLANTTSHDEENYNDPWQALVRNAAAGMMDSASLIFPGQELGISTSFGYDHYELNFGKTIPHFKRWNSMMPAWNDTVYGNDQLYPVYSGIQTARRESPALRSPNRWFLDGTNQIFATVKYEQLGASPATSDVVLAFANLDRNSSPADQYTIPSLLASFIGLKDGREYNVKNIAAYTALTPNRREIFLWPSNYTKSQLESAGFFVQMNSVPNSPTGWLSNPYEAQYLKLFDVTPPPKPEQPVNSTGQSYVMSNLVTFQWAASTENTEDDQIESYKLVIKKVGSDETVFSENVGNTTSYEYFGEYGDHLYAFVLPISVAGIEGAASTASTDVKLIDPDLDLDGDGMTNGDEDIAGTDFNDSNSKFSVTSQTMEANGNVTINWTPIEDRTYAIQTRSDLVTGGWATVAINLISGTWTDENATGDQKFYRVVVE